MKAIEMRDREHQIVIKLNPDQFAQVQQLARKAGAKSAGAFIRQYLMSSLQLDIGEASDAATANWQVIAGQIRRLHRELQLFIAESSALNEDAAIEGVGGIQLVVSDLPESELNGEDDAKLAPSDIDIDIATEKPPDGPEDEVEELADRAFAISPRLGAMDPLSDLLEDTLLNADADDADDDDDYTDDEKDVRGAQYEPETDRGSDDPEAENEAASDVSDTASSDRANDEDSGGFSNPPPVSGGPPPRRRRT